MITTKGWSFTFPVEDIWLGGGRGFNDQDTLQIKLAFEDTNEASLTAIDVDDKKMRIIKYGDIKISFDLSETYLSPLEYKFEILDGKGYLQGLIFDSNDPQDFTPTANPFIEIELYYNGVLEYHGFADTDGLEFDEGSKILKVNAHSNLTAINEERVYDEDNTTALDPLGYISGATTYIKFSDLLLDIYQIAEASYSSITTEHDWVINGRTTTGTYINILDTYLETAYLFNQGGGYHWFESLGDMLRGLASDFFAFTGIMFKNKPFFSELFPESATSSYTLTSSDILDRTKRFEYERLEETSVTSLDIDGTTHTLYIPSGSSPTGVESKKDHRTSVVYYDVNQPAGTVMWYDNGGEHVYECKSPTTVTKDYSEQFLAFIIWKRRLLSIKNRVDKFTIVGLDKVFTDIFTYDGRKWQPLEMEKKYSQNITIIKAILIEEI